MRKLIPFVRYLVNSPRRIRRFCDVLESDFQDYLCLVKAGKKGVKIKPSTLTHVLQVLNMLYDFRQSLPDSLPFRPTGNKSACQVAGLRRADMRNSRTKPLTDADFASLVTAALKVLDSAPTLLGAIASFQEFAAVRLSNLVTWGAVNRRQKCYFAQRNDFDSTKTILAGFRELQAACFIVIAASTGMRISEILSIKTGDLKVEKGDAMTGEVFYWIGATLFKTQMRYGGSPRRWMCGEFAAKAVGILEELLLTIPAPFRPTHLFFCPRPYTSVLQVRCRKKPMPLGISTAHMILNTFGKRCGLRTRLAAHRFRRTFARNIIRWTSTSLVALKSHFHHWSLYMTDWYVGLDPDLIEDLEAERLTLSLETAEKMLTQPVGGVGGHIFSQQLARKLADGSLPPTFTGTAGAQYRRTLIEQLHASGMIVSPCGPFNYCVFKRDVAHCTEGERALIHRCDPTGCPNSFILPEHLPHYQRRLAELLETYQKLSEEEQQGPKGLFYAKLIDKTERAIAPLLKENA